MREKDANLLTTQIDEIITKNTFGLEAAKGVEALRAKAQFLESEVERLESVEKQLREQTGILTIQRDHFESQIAEWKKREEELKKREEDCTRLEINAATSRALHEGYKEAMGLVFRNTITRENTVKSIKPEQKKDVYGNSCYQLPMEEKETESKSISQE